MNTKFWLAIFIVLTIFFAYSTFSYQASLIVLYKQQNTLLLNLSNKQNEWCSGLNKVNKVCEETLIDIMERLGLDKKAYPLITTVMWRRAMKDYPVEKAREELNAPEQIEGKDLSSVSIGGN